MSNTIKVGVFFTLALALLAALILRVEEWHLFGAKGRRIDAVFETVVGLDDKAAVRVAGVRVGRVDGVRLDGNGRSARVTLLLETEVTLTQGAQATIANQGMLGDKFVELDPGPAGAPALPAGAVLPGKSAVGFDQAMAKLEQVGDSIQSALGGFTGGGEGGGGFGALVSSLQKTADELRAVIGENRESLGGTVKNFERFSSALADDLPRITAQLERVLAQVDAVVAENRGSLKESLAGIKELTTSVQRSVDNLNSITDKIASGEGTVGKLINSDEAHTELLGALKSVETGVTTLTDTLGRADKVKLDLGLDAAYLTDAEDWRSSFRLDLAPRGDASPRLYRFELVADPYGRVTEKDEIVTVTGPDGNSQTVTTHRLFSEPKRHEFSALVGFPFAAKRGRLWAGLIENTGGMAVDFGLVPDKLSLSLEAYDFARNLDLDPHVRVTARWYPWHSLFLSAGYDDALVHQFGSPFVGAGIRWSEDDLKYLIGSLPKL